MRQTTSSRGRLNPYASLAVGSVAVLAAQADAGVVNQNVTNGDSYTLTTDFNPSFQITFRAEFLYPASTSYGSTARFSGANLQFINRTTQSPFTGAVARWASGQTIGANAGVGQGSAAGTYYGAAMTNHAWSAMQANPRPVLFMNSSSSIKGAYAWTGAGDTGFVGIRFVDGSDYYYGWVEIEKLAGNADIKIVSWFVSDVANTAVVAGASAPAVPGLGGLAALACGAAGMRRKRSRVA